MEAVSQFMIRVGYTRDNGRVIRGTVKVLNFLLMEIHILVSMPMGNREEKEFTSGETVKYMMANL